jgi:hypothetical protein
MQALSGFLWEHPQEFGMGICICPRRLGVQLQTLASNQPDVAAARANIPINETEFLNILFSKIVNLKSSIL